MANARVIRRNFFNDHLIAGKYNIEQRFLLIGLSCSSDDYGRFWWNPINLKSIIYPTDKKQGKWVENNLELFLNDEILCKYEVNNIKYGHFPQWFDKGFFLKQRLDHPKPEELPDCKIHIMNDKGTRKKREISQTNKINLNKINSNKRDYFPKDFRFDTTGKSQIGYCITCNKTGFYDKNEIWGDSKCCNSKITPTRNLNV